MNRLFSRTISSPFSANGSPGRRGDHGLRATGPTRGPGATIRFHVRDALHGVAMSVRPVEAERRAPVVDHEGHVLRDAERLEERVQVPAVLDERVAVGAAVLELVRVAHADQVRRDAAPLALEVRDDVPPQIRRRRVPVQQHDRVAGADFDVGHRGAEDFEALLLVAFVGEITSLPFAFGSRCSSQSTRAG